MWAHIPVDQLLEVVHLEDLQQLQGDHRDSFKGESAIALLKQLLHSIAQMLNDQAIALIGLWAAPVHPRDAGRPLSHL